jgi:hypothetical protein
MIKKKQSAGIHIFPSELSKIVEWLDNDLMMTASSLKILVTSTSGIGQSVTAIAIDKDDQEIARIDATDYTDW